MKINDKNQTFIYIRTTGEKIPVSREVRDACYGEAARIRMREQADGHCLCPQSEVWVCDGDCLICEHRRFGDLISLDVPVSEDGEDTLLNVVPSDAPSIESVIADRDLLDRLFARLRELDPDADTMIAIRAIAKALGRPQRAFADQMKRYRTELRRIRDF